nr:sigma 54-interacting transcriptional regulator [Halalkalibacter akibai]
MCCNTEHLLEAELFGYEEGAFTGAKKGGNKGKFELADTGTIFLDEIGDMPKQMQTKILRVLEEREVVRVGGATSTPIDVRVIAATNQNLVERVNEGSFREDLYYRLNVIHITIPPLRKRREDIPILFAHYLKLYYEKYKINEKSIADSVLERIKSYDWPGNIRQVVNTAEQLVTLVDGKQITVNDLPDAVRSQPLSINKKPSLKSERVEYERDAIHRILTEVGGNKTKAAKRLGIHRTTLYKKLNELE